MIKYYIKNGQYWLSSHNKVNFEYWSEYTNKNAQKKIFIFAWLKMNLIKLIWRIEKNKDINNLYLEKVK